MAAENPNEGLLPKYRVEKINDPEGKHDDCSYFVLDPKHDKKARSALVHYATLARLDDQEALYQDLMNWVMRLEREDRSAQELIRLSQRMQDMERGKA